MKYYFLISFLFSSVFGFSQYKKIQIIHSDNTFQNEEKYPGAIVALGNVMIEHEGATLQCKQALIYQETNVVKAFGEVFVNQGDTVTQRSKYVHYNGKTKMAKSWGNVVLKDPQMTLTTDTLHFDRENQILIYKNYATLKDTTNTLNSEIGNYFLKTNKFQALSKVIITNPDNKITSDQLDYYTNTGIADLFGPTTIIDLKENNTLYSEEGHHNSKTRISHFIKNAKILYQDRIIEGDSLYYDEDRQFASATGNIIVTDTVNNSIIKGGYSEYFEAIDSVFIVGKPVAINLVENDSMYIHGDTLLVTGKQDARILRAYHHVKFFKKDLQGKCDSLFTNEATGLTKMYRRPILWNDVNQITGDTIHFLSNKETNELDSLKVYTNAFVIKQDSSGGFSQIKGKNLYGKFVKDTLDNILVSGNGQMINYNRNEDKELVAITKMTCSNMEFVFKDGGINLIKYLTKPEGKTYPPSKFPKEEGKLSGFIWRQEEQPLTKDDIFNHDKGDDALIKAIIEAEQTARKEAKEAAELQRIEQEKENVRIEQAKLLEKENTGDKKIDSSDQKDKSDKKPSDSKDIGENSTTPTQSIQNETPKDSIKPPKRK